MKIVRLVGLGLALVAVLVSATGGNERRAVIGCQAESGKRIDVTRGYYFTLLVGKVESMYMPYQVRANHLKHGEAMLRGTMSGSLSLLTGGPIRHLEVQICARRTSAVVTYAEPRITVVDATTGKVRKLPVAVMEDIAMGTADLHYGNNITMSPNHRYLVSVTWRGQRVTCRVGPRA